MNIKILEDGKLIDCNVITVFKDDNNIDYIVYTDGTLDEDGLKNIYASRYKKLDDGNIELFEIEDDKEWDMIDEVLRSIDGYGA